MILIVSLSFLSSLSAVSGQIVVLSGSITVLSSSNVTVNVTPMYWYDADLPTAYGFRSVRSSSKASGFVYGPSVSSFSVASGGNVTMVFLNTLPVGCALDSVRVSLSFGRFGSFGPFGPSSNRFWVLFDRSSDPSWRYNLTFVHNRLSHRVDVFFAAPVLPVVSPSGSGVPFIVFVVASSVLVGVIAFIAVRILRLRY